MAVGASILILHRVTNGKGIRSTRMSVAEPQLDPYRQPAQKSVSQQKETKMSEPTSRNKRIAVQSFLLAILAAMMLVAHGVFYPLMNTGLAVCSMLAIIVLGFGGGFAIALHNE